MAQDLACLHSTRPETNEEWLATFHHLATEGLDQHESEYPRLLHGYEQALHHANTSLDPPFHPPDDFKTHLSESGRLREWRSSWRFPEVSYLARAADHVQKCRNGCLPIMQPLGRSSPLTGDLKSY